METRHWLLSGSSPFSFRSDPYSSKSRFPHEASKRGSYGVPRVSVVHVLLLVPVLVEGLELLLRGFSLVVSEGNPSDKAGELDEDLPLLLGFGSVCFRALAEVLE